VGGSIEEGLEYIGTLLEWKGDGDFTLDRIGGILRALGDPQDKVPALHVAGTNGKGSVSAALSAILGAGGYRVGLNISPHLARVNERIIVDGYELTDEQLSFYALWLKQVCNSLNVRPTMHEGLTAMAFLAFADMKLDWMVIEVGLGGRLDSSNVLSRPVATCITSIGLDHEHILGGTHSKIAEEKAGIAKSGVPMIVGPLSLGAREAVERICRVKSAPIEIFGREYEAAQVGERARFSSERHGSFYFTPSLGGRHQVENMAVAIHAAMIAGATRQDCIDGVASVHWPARLENVVYRNKRIVFDCAHNEPGVLALLDYLKTQGLRELRIGFGVLDTKNWQQMLALLIPYCRDWNLIQPLSARAVPSMSVEGYLSSNGVSATCFENDYARFISEVLDSPEEETVLITGSMYMLGHLRDMLVDRKDCYWKRAIKIS
jgi:dihydrofolate synthase/folylpolyglutamate synthase